LDNDCNGVIDDPFPGKNQACSDGQGVCRAVGIRICNAAHDDLVCTATATDPPETPYELSCDNKDNDCDGQTDEIEDLLRPAVIASEMVLLTIDKNPDPDHRFYIDRWEASRPDATSGSRGLSTATVCSRPEVIPWDDIDWTHAKAACESRGKRLCTDEEWEFACGGANNWDYPYHADTFDSETCNSMNPAVSTTDFFDGCDDPDQSAIMDLSGNVAEWVTCRPEYYDRDCATLRPYYGGYYGDSIEVLYTCWFRNNAGPVLHYSGLGFRCCLDAP
jgi:hypothetical protein